MAHTLLRLAKTIERELSTILLFDAKNPLLKYVSVTKVTLTSDLQIATIYYTVIGNDNEINKTKEILESSKGYLRTTLAKKIDTRKTPELKFKYDESLIYGKKIEELLNNTK